MKILIWNVQVKRFKFRLVLLIITHLDGNLGKMPILIRLLSFPHFHNEAAHFIAEDYLSAFSDYCFIPVLPVKHSVKFLLNFMKYFHRYLGLACSATTSVLNKYSHSRIFSSNLLRCQVVKCLLWCQFLYA